MTAITTPPAAGGPSAPANPVAVVARQAFSARLRFALTMGGALAAFSAFGFAAFTSLGDDADSLTEDLPEAFESLIGASASGNYIVSQLFGTIGPAALLVLVISAGVRAIAGEERAHTASLLLAQPVRRRDVVLAKAGVLVAHLAIALAVFVAGLLAFNALFDGGLDVANGLATSLHLFALALAFGMFALALGCWTGSTSTSNGVAASVAVVANLVAGLVPLVDGLEGVAKVSPWYYYNGSDPLSNGLDPLHLVVLLSLAALGFFGAMATVTRRDIDAGQHGSGLAIPALDRLTAPIVRSTFAKAISERVVLLAVVVSSVASMTIAVSLMFDGLQETMADLTADLPENFTRLLGGADMATPVGWIDAEMVAILLPLVAIGVAVNIGVSAIAGEAERHTLALLLAAPISRRRVVAEKAAALAVVILTIGVTSGLSILAGSALADLGLDAGNIAGTSAHLTLIGLFFGAVALAVGAIASKSIATRVAAGLAALSYLVASFFPASDALAPWAKISPWHYYNSSSPLENGADPLHLLVLAVLTAIAFAAALVLVDRRDVDA